MRFIGGFDLSCTTFLFRAEREREEGGDGKTKEEEEKRIVAPEGLTAREWRLKASLRFTITT